MVAYCDATPARLQFRPRAWSTQSGAPLACPLMGHVVRAEAKTTVPISACVQSREMIFSHQLRRVWKSHAEFHNYFISKGIFIQPELKKKIRALSNMMYDAIRERQLDAENPVLGEGHRRTHVRTINICG
jgi:hypothetical protein